MIGKVLLVSLAGGLICLDRVALQSMVSRPIVAAPLVGLILQDLPLGLMIGALVELLWIDRMPIGTYVPPNDTIAALLAASTAILGGQALGHPSRELAILAILLMLPCGLLAQKMDWLITRANDRLSKGALEDVRRGDLQGISRRHLQALLQTFLLNVLFLFLFLQLGLFILVRLFPHLPTPALKTLTMTYYFLPCLGIAVALGTIKHRGTVPLFCGIYLGALLLLEFIRYLHP